MKSNMATEALRQIVDGRRKSLKNTDTRERNDFDVATLIQQQGEIFDISLTELSLSIQEADLIV